MASSVQDLTGRRFGRLLVIRKTICDPKGNGRRLTAWECACDCGRSTTLQPAKLLSGHTRSCGCLHRDTIRTHGHAKTPEYKVWHSMIDRCTNPLAGNWHRYGGRGIRVCQRWTDSVAHFIEDVGRRPGPGYSIDRIDVDGHYEPGNVRWATAKEQQRNRRNTTFVRFRGETVSLAEVAEALSIDRNVLRNRIGRGWPESRWGEPFSPRKKRR